MKRKCVAAVVLLAGCKTPAKCPEVRCPEVKCPAVECKCSCPEKRCDVPMPQDFSPRPSVHPVYVMFDQQPRPLAPECPADKPFCSQGGSHPTMKFTKECPFCVEGK